MSSFFVIIYLSLEKMILMREKKININLNSIFQTSVIIIK